MTFYPYPDYAPREPWPEAACLGCTAQMVMPHLDRSTYAPSYGRASLAKVARAKALCAGCPMLGPCRAWALTQPDPCVGLVAGGMTPAERQRARRES